MFALEASFELPEMKACSSDTSLPKDLALGWCPKKVFKILMKVMVVRVKAI